MTFPRTDYPLRTDQSFRERIQSEHHAVKSPLEELPIDMVADFPTSDPLHLLELGVMKKCLVRWIRSFSNNDLEKVNQMLESANKDRPTEIHRSIRSLKYLCNWKGSEFRTILLYVGIVALKDCLRKEEYDHFVMLSCATTICSTDHFRKYVLRRENNALSLVDNLLLDYIEKYIDLYGTESITSNVHNLCHLTDDVRRFGNLNTISTYPYENALRTLKLKIKKCNKPLEQISRRIKEVEKVMDTKVSINISSLSSHESNEIPIFKYPMTVDQSAYETIIFDGFRLSNRKYGDKWISYKSLSGHICILEFIKAVKKTTIQGIETLVCGKPIINKNDYFTSPFKSSNLNIFISNGERGSEICIRLNAIICKLVCMHYKNSLVFVPLLHTYRQ